MLGGVGGVAWRPWEARVVGAELVRVASLRLE